jgi:hypothetical protein
LVLRATDKWQTIRNHLWLPPKTTFPTTREVAMSVDMLAKLVLLWVSSKLEEDREVQRDKAASKIA